MQRIAIGLVVLAAWGCAEAEPAPASHHEVLTTSKCVTIQRGQGKSAVADAYIKPNALKKNFGDKPVLRVSSTDEALLRFDLASIPPSATVTQATLKLFANGEAGGGRLELHRITAPWSEPDVTYGSFKQAFSPTLVAALRLESRTAQKSIDVTSLVSSWVRGTSKNYGFELEVGPDHEPRRQHDCDDDSDPTLFVSSEGQQARRPALEVCYSLFSDECEVNPCRNGGTCSNGSQGFSCDCAPGFAGPTCGEVLDHCASGPCLNGSACANAGDGYTCVCPPGYSGQNCETDINDCAGEPCQNGGVCSDGVGSFSCACAPGFDGDACEHAIDNCEGTPCHNGGSCTSEPGGFKCACPAGFSGQTCDTNIDDCASSGCVNGTCVDGVGSYSCSCAPDWGGTRCDVNLNTCSQAPCLNGGTCTNGAGTYTCACKAGYTGANCEIDVNDCSPNPCQNDGVCVDGVASHACVCPAGWEGAACETAVVKPLRVRVNDLCYDLCTSTSDPDQDGWGLEQGARCVVPGSTQDKQARWCDMQLPPSHEVPPSPIDAQSMSVALIPRPLRLDVPPPRDCPYDAEGLVPLDPAWLHQGSLHIPEDTRALVHGNDEISASTLIRRLHIPETSELIFADQPGAFRVTDVMVHGALRLGSPTCRLQSNIEFEFDTDEPMPNSAAVIAERMGLGIMVAETGVLDMFGRLYQPTWTRLAATASAGASALSLAEVVDWEPGQKLVIATSHRVDYPFADENEVRTIASVDGANVTLDSPLEHQHYGGPEYQVEVGLLSRSLKFRPSERLTTAAPLFGGHIMVHSKNARVSGVELYRMGQQNFLGRYPFHFHRAGDVAGGGYLTDSSIWNSNFRCAVLHRTDRAALSRNVAFDTWGHCYYLEDGVEMNNELSFNLAVRTKVMGPIAADLSHPGSGGTMSDLLNNAQTGFTRVASRDMIQPADRAASGFYISNGNNRIIGNAASGGFAGFSLPNLPRALGGSVERIFPIDYGASHFDGNTAHSAGYFSGNGACVYVGGTLTEEEQLGGALQYVSGRDQAHERQRLEVFNNTKTFLCDAGMVHWGSKPRIVNFESWDNGILARLFGSASIQSTLVVGTTGNVPTRIIVDSWRNLALPLAQSRQGFQFYDTWTQTILKDVTFRSFKDAASSALFSMTHSDEFTPQQMNTVAGLHFSDVADAKRLRIDDSKTLSSRNFNVVDYDGSLSGEVGAGLPPGPRLVASGHTDAWRFSSQCVDQEPWGALVCPLQAPQGIAAIQTTADKGARVTMYGLDNTTFGDNWFSSDPLIGNSQMTGPSGAGWHYKFAGGVPPWLWVHAMQVPVDSFVLLTFTLPPNVRCKVSATLDPWQVPQVNWTEAGSLSALLESTGPVYATAQNTCFVRIPHYDAGAFEASGLSVPNIPWSGASPLTGFTINTGCAATNPACATVGSQLPILP